jgi:hypothetical protein
MAFARGLGHGLDRGGDRRVDFLPYDRLDLSRWAGHGRLSSSGSGP